MTKCILSDDDLLDVYRSLDNPKHDRDSVIEAMGAAVDAAMSKLEEQEPVMHVRTCNGEIHWSEDCITEEYDEILLDAFCDVDDDGNKIKNGFGIIPLYAHPAPALEPDYYFYKGKLHCNDGGTHLNHGAKEHGRALYDNPCVSTMNDKALRNQDPLQPAANWLYEAIVECMVVDIQSALRIGYNRAQRLHAAAPKYEG